MWISYSDDGREVCIALFNLSEQERDIQVSLRAVADIIPDGSAWISDKGELTEVWDGGRAEASDGTVSCPVPRHGVKVFKAVS